MSLSPGTRLGPYEIAAPLGAGGMGEVYRARDTRLDREVAIKVLPPEFAQNERLLQRFEREAKIISQLNQPNVCTVFDVGTAKPEGGGEQADVHYLVMELLEGESLAERLQKGALPLHEVLKYGQELASALDAAHRRQITHRDLKPGNIMLTRSGAKLLDFGLAKSATEGPTPGGGLTNVDTEAMPLTTEGAIVGTFQYMAPEQLEGLEADARTDIFALGAVIYEMATGHRAFQGRSQASLIAAIVSSQPAPISSLVAMTPPALDHIVRRCLAKDPEDRWQSAHDLAYALEAVKDFSGEIPRVEAVAMTRGAKVPLFALVFVALAVAVGVIEWRWLLGARGGARDETAAGRMVQLTFEKGAELDPSVSPDGNSFVYVAVDGGDSDIFQQRVGGENRINLTADCDEDDIMPAYSPDGTMIAFRSAREGGGLFVMGATGESVRRLSDFGFNPSWSPDGQRVLFADEAIFSPTARNLFSGVWSVDVRGGQPERIFAGDGVEPVMSPNGRFYAFWGLPSGTGKRILSTLAVAGGDTHPLNDDNFFNWNPTWSGDGRSLYFTSNRGGTMDLWRLPMDPATGRATGPAQPVTMSTLTISQPSVTHDGSRIVYGSQYQTSRITRMSMTKEAPADQPVILLEGSRDIWEVEASPDGRWLALKAADPYEDLFVASVDGSGLRRLTNDTYKDRELCFSPDSKKLYFFSDRSGRYEVWSIRVDGSELTQITDTQGDSPANPFVSPDGKRLIVASTQRSSGLVDLTQKLPVQQADWIASPNDSTKFVCQLWYPDGKAVLGTPATAGGHWYRLDVETRSYTELPAVAPNLVEGEKFFQPRWVVPGRSVLQMNGTSLEEVDLDTGASKHLRTLDSASTLAMSPDGRWIYVLQKFTESDIWMLDLSQASAR